ncbi:MAG: MOSC domain-containing protein [Cohaesibacter sp.]|nr:MOSC domain-containing protein [Cohaesibacter sp.]
MPNKLTAIYRYPVKGFSAQALEVAEIEAGKPLHWDRAFAIENGPSGFDATKPEHIRKNAFLVLMRQPELARLKTDFDPQSGLMTIKLDDEIKAKGNLLDHKDQSESISFLENFCEKPLRGKASIIHSQDHAFTDSRTQDMTLINLASLRALEEKIGGTLDPLRFRANFYFDSTTPWIEHDWVGQKLQIGDVTFHVRKRTQRCAATNANLVTGKRDQMIPKVLMQHFDHADMGIHIVAEQAGQIQIGNSVKATEPTNRPIKQKATL